MYDSKTPIADLANATFDRATLLAASHALLWGDAPLRAKSHGASLGNVKSAMTIFQRSKELFEHYQKTDAKSTVSEAAASAGVAVAEAVLAIAAVVATAKKNRPTTA